MLSVYVYVEDAGLDIVRANLGPRKALSVKDLDTIALDRSITDETDQQWLLWHELGHFATQAFYTLLSPLQTWGRCEAKADGWMIRQLCPVEDIRKALDAGCRTYWELAEVLDVGAELAERAVMYYTRKGEI